MALTSRRGFLAGCSAAIAGLAGSRFNTLAFAAGGGEATDEVLVVLFLRGGMDGLNFLAPIDGVDRGFYEVARPDLALPLTGPEAALPLAQGSGFGLHPNAGPLLDLYQDGKLALIQAVGLADATRSHFDAMALMELGAGLGAVPSTGWLTRHLQSVDGLPAEIVVPALSVGDLQHTSLLGENQALSVDDVSKFNIKTGFSEWRDAQRVALRHMFEGPTDLHDRGIQALDAMDVVELYVSDDYVPDNGAVYPVGDFGDRLQTVAQLIKLDLGLRVAAIDLGGWDTHQAQGDGTDGDFAELITELSAGLHAFYKDLDGGGAQNHTQRLTVVAQSEFGRRLKENADRGTDHGRGNTMMVLSGNAVGGLHGQFPGLANDQLFNGADLEVTTDYRQVLSEILIRRMGNPHLGDIFPDYQGYEPLGVVSGADLPVDYGCTGPDDVTLSDRTIAGVEVHEACNSVTVGQNVVVTTTGDATLRAGTTVSIDNGFEVVGNGKLTVECK